MLTWRRNGIPLVQTVPHIRIRLSTTTYISTLLLVVDNFQDSDSGIYQCGATQDGESAVGLQANLIGMECIRSISLLL